MISRWEKNYLEMGMKGKKMHIFIYNIFVYRSKKIIDEMKKRNRIENIFINIKSD